jgi:hypothetical protein
MEVINLSLFFNLVFMKTNVEKKIIFIELTMWEKINYINLEYSCIFMTKTYDNFRFCQILVIGFKPRRGFINIILNNDLTCKSR